MVEAEHQDFGTERSIDVTRRLLARLESRYGRDNQLTINAMTNLALFMYRAHRLDEATALDEEALGYLSLRRGPDYEATLVAECGLGLTFLKAGRYEEAIPLLTHVTEVTPKPNGCGSEETASYIMALAQSFWKLGRYEEARVNYERSIEAYRLLDLAEHRSASTASFWLAVCIEAEGDLARAIQLQRTVVEQFGRVYGIDDPKTLNARMYLARWLHRVNENAEAKVLLLGVIEVETRSGAGEEDSREARQLLADIERSEGTG